MSITEPAIDGRTARAQRTRLAIVDALLALIEEGDLAPPAPRIAERAGVSLRSIYQHFDDLDALFGAAATREIERILTTAERIGATGTLGTRLDGFVRQRAHILEAMTPVRRAVLLQEPFSRTLKVIRRNVEELGRTEIGRVFGPELRALGPFDRNVAQMGIGAASSWSTWDYLRSTDVPIEAAHRVMRRMVEALLTGGTA